MHSLGKGESRKVSAFERKDPLDPSGIDLAPAQTISRLQDIIYTGVDSAGRAIQAGWMISSMQ